MIKIKGLFLDRTFKNTDKEFLKVVQCIIIKNIVLLICVTTALCITGNFWCLILLLLYTLIESNGEKKDGI